MKKFMIDNQLELEDLKTIINELYDVEDLKYGIYYNKSKDWLTRYKDVCKEEIKFIHNCTKILFDLIETICEQVEIIENETRKI